MYFGFELFYIIRLQTNGFTFSVQFFCGNFSYQEAISRTSPAAVNILSSSSGIH